MNEFIDPSPSVPVPTADDIALEQSLRRVQPRPARLDRDRLMFLAGQVSVTPPHSPTTFPARETRARWRPRGSFWPALSTALALALCWQSGLWYQADLARRDLHQQLLTLQQKLSDTPAESPRLPPTPRHPADDVASTRPKPVAPERPLELPVEQTLEPSAALVQDEPLATKQVWSNSLSLRNWVLQNGAEELPLTPPAADQPRPESPHATNPATPRTLWQRDFLDRFDPHS